VPVGRVHALVHLEQLVKRPLVSVLGLFEVAEAGGDFARPEGV